MRTLTLAAALAAGAAVAEPAQIMTIPVPSAERGRLAFVAKGCVICHAINGAGGLAAPPLDAQEPAGVFDPLDFAARMWRGAWAMADLQATEFGDVIRLTGQEIADIAAFSENHALQQRFSLDEVPEMMRVWILDGYDEDAPPRP